MTSKVKTIAADEPAYDAFRQLAKEYQLSNPELLAAMVQYFRVTKADPRQPTGPDLTTSLAMLGEKLDKLDKRTIGFIREQEKQYLKPILAEVQAHQVLSTPAASAPVGLSDAQVQELRQWFELVLARGLLPVALTETFRAQAPPSGAAPVPKDPQLDPVKKVLLAVIRAALTPEILTVALNPTPSAPAAAPVSPPTQPA